MNSGAREGFVEVQSSKFLWKNFYNRIEIDCMKAEQAQRKKKYENPCATGQLEYPSFFDEY